MSKCSEGNFGLVHDGFMLVIADLAIYCLLGRKFSTNQTGFHGCCSYRLYEAVGLGWVYGFTKYDPHVCPAV